MGCAGRMIRALARKARTLSRFPRADRRLALTAIALTAAMRVALWTLPFRWIKGAVESRARHASRGVTARQIGWAVRLASRYVPRASCLTQALTAQMLLKGSGLDSRLHIGVAKGTGFEAHAWVECGGRVLVGGAVQSARYKTILTF